MGYVHIDDVALCQILVYENEGSHGRYLCSSTVMGEDDLASLLANRYPTLPISKRLVNAFSLHYVSNHVSILTLLSIFSVKIGIKIVLQNVITHAHFCVMIKKKKMYGTTVAYYLLLDFQVRETR